MSLTAVVLAISSLALLAYLFCRAVIWARRRGRGSDFVAGVIGSADVGGALNPAHEVIQESRRVKRSEEGSGDPDEIESQEGQR